MRIGTLLPEAQAFLNEQEDEAIETMLMSWSQGNSELSIRKSAIQRLYAQKQMAY